MSEDLALGAGLTMAGVIVGAALTYLIDKGSWRRTEALAARTLVADTFEFAWGHKPHSQVQVHLMKVRASLEALDVPDVAISALEQATMSCWRDGRANADEGTWTVNRNLLEKLYSAIDTTGACLRSRRSRKAVVRRAKKTGHPE